MRICNKIMLLRVKTRILAFWIWGVGEENPVLRQPAPLSLPLSLFSLPLSLPPPPFLSLLASLSPSFTVIPYVSLSLCLARLHIGHSFVTHSFSLKVEEPPMCIGCDKRLTIEHILLTCSDLIEIRECHFTAKSLRMLFQDISTTIFKNPKHIGGSSFSKCGLKKKSVC